MKLYMSLFLGTANIAQLYALLLYLLNLKIFIDIKVACVLQGLNAGLLGSIHTLYTVAYPELVSRGVSERRKCEAGEGRCQ